MRVIFCLFLLLPACTTHAMRCDGHLQPINSRDLDAVNGAAAASGALRTAPEEVR